MKKEFKLSDKIVDLTGGIEFLENTDFALDLEDVKEFIRLLKDEIINHIAGSDKFYDDNPENLLKYIDKLLGEEFLK